MTTNVSVELAYTDDEVLDRILARVYAILIESLDSEDESQTEKEGATEG